MTIVKICKFLKPIVEPIIKAGGHPVLAGGCVRDLLMSKHITDIDIEVFFLNKLNLDRILSKFNAIDIGVSFGISKITYRNTIIDISLPRKDFKSGIGHKGFNIELNPYQSFKQAAMRRDFTVNSIGVCLKHIVIMDPFNGVLDISNKIIRPVRTSVFGEDPLRILRAARFSSSLNFSIHESIPQIFINDKIDITHLSIERIQTEMHKILSSTKPTNGLLFLSEIGCFRIFKVKINIISKLDDTNNIMLRLSLLALTNHDIHNIAMITNLFNMLRKKNIVRKIVSHIIQIMSGKPVLIQYALLCIRKIDVNVCNEIQKVFNVRLCKKCQAVVEQINGAFIRDMVKKNTYINKIINFSKIYCISIILNNYMSNSILQDCDQYDVSQLKLKLNILLFKYL